MHFFKISCDVKALLREAADRDSHGVHLLCSVHPESEFHIYVNIDIKVKTCSVVFDLLQPHGL